MLRYMIKMIFYEWLEDLDHIRGYLCDNYSIFEVVTGRWRGIPTIDARRSKSKRLKYSKVGYKPPKVKIRRRRRSSREKVFLN